MKKLITLALLVCFIATSSIMAQVTDSDYRKGQFYFSTETEIIFSFANMDADSVTMDNVLRWSPVFNFMGRMNYDFSKNVGVDIGLGFRNVGFIAKYPQAENDLKKKFRTYNFGLPIGVKFGDLNQKNPFFLFAGYELEMPFHYKEKTFENGDKTKKVTGWFSDRTDLFTQSVYAGVQFPQGFSLKFKYYLDNFFNTDYVLYTDGVRTTPYAGMDVHVFYFSIAWYPFHQVLEKETPKRQESIYTSKWR